MAILLVVLAQKVLAIVVAVGCANHGVNVITGRPVAFEGDPALMVKLNENYWTMYAVVKNAFLFGSPHPGKAGFLEVPGHFVEFDPSVSRRDPVDVDADQIDQNGLLMASQFVVSNTLRSKFKVIPERCGEKLHGEVFGDDGFAPLVCGEGLGQF